MAYFADTLNSRAVIQPKTATGRSAQDAPARCFCSFVPLRDYFLPCDFATDTVVLEVLALPNPSVHRTAIV